MVRAPPLDPGAGRPITRPAPKAPLLLPVLSPPRPSPSHTLPSTSSPPRGLLAAPESTAALRAAHCCQHHRFCAPCSSSDGSDAGQRAISRRERDESLPGPASSAANTFPSFPLASSPSVWLFTRIAIDTAEIPSSFAFLTTAAGGKFFTPFHSYLRILRATGYALLASTARLPYHRAPQSSSLVRGNLLQRPRRWIVSSITSPRHRLSFDWLWEGSLADLDVVLQTPSWRDLARSSWRTRRRAPPRATRRRASG